MLTINTVPTEQQRKHWTTLGYNDERMSKAAGLQSAIALQHSPEAGQTILEYLYKQRYTKKLLLFVKWDSDTLYAKDERNNTHAIIGSWEKGNYLLRGVVKRRSKQSRRWSWSINGQASTGSEQVAHIGEQDSVKFPELENAIDDAHVYLYGVTLTEKRAYPQERD